MPSISFYIFTKFAIELLPPSKKKQWRRPRPVRLAILVEKSQVYLAANESSLFAAQSPSRLIPLLPPPPINCTDATQTEATINMGIHGEKYILHKIILIQIKIKPKPW